jgi:chemotaxis protein MotA
MGGFAPGFSIVFLSFLTMFAGTLALAGLSAPSDITRGSFRLIREPLPLTLDKLVTELEEISVITRRDGLLALESRRKELKEPLLKLLLKRIVEGFDKTQTLHLLRNQALRRAELIRTTEIYIERITALLPTVGLIPALLILIDYLSHPDKVPAPGSLPTLFFPFVLALIAQLIVSALAGRFFDEIKENVKLYYVLMEEGVSGIQDGTNAEMLRDRLRARWADSPQWDD